MPAVKRPGPTKGQNPNAKRQGTAPRTVMPAPTPPKPAAPEPAPAESEEAASKAVLDFAKQSVGTKVGSGECYDLADQALKASGAKNAADHGKITTDGDYVWGREVPLGDVKPGDVIQFRDYKFDKRTDKTDGSWNSEDGKRPHHTAVIESINDQGVAVVIEQNVGEKTDPDLKKGRRSTIPLKSTSTATEDAKSTVTVTGTVKVFRAVPKPPKK